MMIFKTGFHSTQGLVVINNIVKSWFDHEVAPTLPLPSPYQYQYQSETQSTQVSTNVVAVPPTNTTDFDYPVSLSELELSNYMIAEHCTPEKL